MERDKTPPDGVAAMARILSALRAEHGLSLD